MFLSNNRNSIVSLVLICALFMVTSCTKDPPDDVVTISKDEYNEEEINTISNRLSTEFLNHPSEFPILSETDFVAAYGYVRQSLNTMVNTAHVNQRNTLDWNFMILHDDNTKRSFALPSGEIYMTTGLLKIIENESQFMTLLSHEIYYIDNDLIMPHLVNEFGGKVFGDLLLDKPVNQAEDIVLEIKSISYDEPTVKTADSFAMTNICPFEYDSYEFKNLIETLKNVGGPIDWLLMRPGGEDRYENLINSSVSCDDEEPIEETRYQMFKNNLLP